MTRSTSVLFVHGMYMNGESWSPWFAKAEAHGYTPVAPSWPFHDGKPADLRASIDPGLGRLTFPQVVSHYAEIIRALPEPTRLVGHSVGGLVVQKLISMGLGVSGVAICPAPPNRLFSFNPHFFRANFPHLNPLAGNRPVVMTPERFHYTFGNASTREESDAAFEAYVVPESRNVPRSSLGPSGYINFGKRHAPMLLIGASEDHLIPADMVERNAKKYHGAGVGVDHVAFEGRSHLICNQEGWEEVAEHTFGWLESHDGPYGRD